MPLARSSAIRNPLTVPIAWICAGLPLLGWWLTGLFDLDEGFYGAITAEMNRRGEWITPYLNGEPWFEKPILIYWLAKPMTMLFGTEIGMRLPSVLCTLGTVAVVGAFAKRHLQAGAQPLAMFFLGTSLLVGALGRLMMTDAPLMLALTGALTSFYHSLIDEQARLKWRSWTGFWLGIGVLAKGPVAILFFGLIAGIYAWRQPDQRSGYRGGWLVGLTALALIVAAWYLPAWLRHRQFFVDEFLIKQNVGRFLGGDRAHSGGLAALPIFYFPVLLLAVIPWGLQHLRAFRLGAHHDALGRYLGVWWQTIFVFFSLSGAKLPHYILPVIAPMALLAAKFASEHSRRPVSALGGLAMAAIVSVVLNTLQWIWYRDSGQREAHALMRKHPEVIGTFRLSRQTADLGTGTGRLQETSLPSLLMVAGRTLIETDDPQLLAQGESVRYFTRRSRLPLLPNVKVVDETRHFVVVETRPAK